jgi:hypothetical protein
VPFEQEAGWAPELVWTIRKSEKVLPLPGTEYVNGGFYDSYTESGHQHVIIQETDTLIMSSQ